MLSQQKVVQADMICQYNVDQYIDKLIAFHGNFAPGLFIGGFMVDVAVRKVSQYEFFDAICESTSCLPDAIQMLTPCTVGNGWLKIFNTGRFAIALYEKHSGEGVRVGVDPNRLDRYPEIRNWFLRLVAKPDQDKNALMNEIKQAGQDILFVKPIRVASEVRIKKPRAPVALCASCGETYPKNGSVLCPACQGMDIYEQ